MWHTGNGDRVLDGAEAKLFAKVLWDFITELEELEGDYDVDLAVFDRLTYGQKISLLSIIAKGLFMPNVPIRKLTSVVEGAIAAVFNHLRIAVITEIEEPPSNTQWRKMILAARREQGGRELPKISCGDDREWFDQIDDLSDLILWDADYESEDFYMDKHPVEAEVLKHLMGILDDYFLEVPEDLRPEEIKTKVSEVKSLCRSVCEKQKL